MSFIIGLLSLIVVLGVLVFVHEAGHFIAAKWAASSSASAPRSHG
jgi:membrane-associated protease RseP (regulator of RpoE activity)